MLIMNSCIDYISIIGVCSCSKKSIRWLLTEKGVGNAVCLVVGGATEALEARPGSLTLTMAQRKGFTRIALELGLVCSNVFCDYFPIRASNFGFMQ